MCWVWCAVSLRAELSWHFSWIQQHQTTVQTVDAGPPSPRSAMSSAKPSSWAALCLWFSVAPAGQKWQGQMWTTAAQEALCHPHGDQERGAPADGPWSCSTQRPSWLLLVRQRHLVNTPLFLNHNEVDASPGHCEMNSFPQTDMHLCGSRPFSWRKPHAEVCRTSTQRWLPGAIWGM